MATGLTVMVLSVLMSIAVVIFFALSCLVDDYDITLGYGATRREHEKRRHA
jgi:hypothetical protein